MGVLEKIKKRRSYDVTVGGEQVKITALTLRDLERLEELKSIADKSTKPLQTALMLGICLCEDNGNPAYSKIEREFPVTPPEDGEPGADAGSVVRMETDIEFAERISEELKDVHLPTIGEIVAAINRVGKVDADDIAKN